MKLVLFSGGFDEENKAMNQALVDMVETTSPRFTYIPSYSYGSELEFREFVRRFRKYNVSKFLHFAVDLPYDNVLFEEAFKSDLIFLSGGNTFYFLSQLRKKKLFTALKNFVKKGGILAGLSAGAILMTPNVHTAGFPDFDCDDNDEGITNWRGLDLTPFEFFPHYVNSKRYHDELMTYSKTTENAVYGVPDGSGIIINGDNISFVEKQYCFLNGKKFRLI